MIKQGGYEKKKKKLANSLSNLLHPYTATLEVLPLSKATGILNL
jgi:hypothetical protein